MSTDIADGGSLVIDKRGSEHVVTLHETRNPLYVHLAYRTRARGEHTWTHASVGTNEEVGTDVVSAFISTDGNDVEVIALTCNEVSATEAPIGATHLPAPREVSSYNCDDDDDSPGSAPIGVVPLPRHRVEILYDDGTLLVGTPGGEFKKAATVPGAFTVGLSRDAKTNRLWLVGYRRINGVYSLTVWSRRPAGSWGAAQPVPCPVCAAYAGSIRLSLAVNNHRMAMAEESLDGSFRIAHGTPSGHWQAPVRLPHSTADLQDVTLAYNPQSVTCTPWGIPPACRRPCTPRSS